MEDIDDIQKLSIFWNDDDGHRIVYDIGKEDVVLIERRSYNTEPYCSCCQIRVLFGNGNEIFYNIANLPEYHVVRKQKMAA